MTLSNDEFNCIEFIINNRTTLLKFGHQGKPKWREFWLSQDCECIHWHSKAKSSMKTRLLISDIKQMSLGQKTNKFKRLARDDLTHLSFSLIYQDGGRTEDSLDVVCRDNKEYTTWINALTALLVKEKRASFHQSRQKQSQRSSSSTTPRNLMRGQSNAFLDKLPAPKTNTKGPKSQRSAFQGTNDVWAFGCNDWGQLGIGNLREHLQPELSKPLLGIGVNQIACGWSHTCVLLASNSILQFGNRVGTGRGDDSLMPKPLQFPPTMIISQVACGDFHSAALSEDGRVFTWGMNINGQLGLGHTDDIEQPQLVEALQDVQIVNIDCGGNSTAALSGEDAYTWGNNVHGQLGHDSADDEWSPRQVIALRGCSVKDISVGSGHMMALTATGNIFSWGWNACGQLGLGHKVDVSRPEEIKINKGVGKVCYISCGDAHSAAIVNQAKRRILYMWGSNGSHQLGMPVKQMKDLCSPAALPFAWQAAVVECGPHHTVVLTTDCEVLTAGDNSYGQLGRSKSRNGERGGRGRSNGNSTPRVDDNHSVALVPGAPPMNGSMRRPSLSSQVSSERHRRRPSSSRMGELTDSMTRLSKTNSLTVDNSSESSVSKGGSSGDDALFHPVQGLSGKSIRGIAVGGDATYALAPRAWVNDQDVLRCMGTGAQCKGDFTVVNRRHHCRNCGGIFCNPCSSKTIAILTYDYKEPVRVCDKCYTRLYDAKFEV